MRLGGQRVAMLAARFGGHGGGGGGPLGGKIGVEGSQGFGCLDHGAPEESGVLAFQQ